MDFLKNNLTKTDRHFGLLYVINFIVSFHLFFIVYFNSTFLNAEGLSNRSVSLLYITGSLLSIGGFLIFPKILRVWGNYKSVLGLIVLEFIAFGILAFTEEFTLTIVAFLIYLSIFPLILISFDIFLEGIIENESTTGNIRGIFLTIANTALIIAPLTAGFLLSENGNAFRYMYFISGALLIPLFFIIALRLREFKDSKYKKIEYKKTVAEFRENKNLNLIGKRKFKS